MDLIKKFKQSLNYLSIENDSNMILNLGQKLPYKLEYLSLQLDVKSSNDLEVFLLNTKNIFIEKLIIKVNIECIEDILTYIKKYIMKEKRVKYLAIGTGHSTRQDLMNQNELSEFESYNIKVKNFDYLSINYCNDIFRFINEMY